MLSCKQISEKASAYVDEELSFTQRISYRLHLLMCDNCRRFVRNFYAGIAMMQRHYDAGRSPVGDEAITAICHHVQQKTHTDD